MKCLLWLECVPLCVAHVWVWYFPTWFLTVLIPEGSAWVNISLTARMTGLLCALASWAHSLPEHGGPLKVTGSRPPISPTSSWLAAEQAFNTCLLTKSGSDQKLCALSSFKGWSKRWVVQKPPNWWPSIVGRGCGQVYETVLENSKCIIVKKYQ